VRGRPDCPTAWYAVEPRGWICNDNTTILETEKRHLGENADRLVRSLQSATSSEGPLPFGYALSLGAPMYGRIPTAAEQTANESMYGAPGGPLGPWARGHDGLASGGSADASPEVPWFLADGSFAPMNVRGEGRLIRKLVPRGSMVSFASAFEAEGRTWLLTPELAIIPADRVRLYRSSSFAGVSLGDALTLPIAWIRKTARAKCRRAMDGRIVPTGETWEARTAVGLTGGSITQNDRVFLATVEPGTFIAASDATVVEKSQDRPDGVGPDDKWIQISITKGTLTAYEGERATFSTLISPGRGGLPKVQNAGNKELVKHRNTPLGVYRVQYKDRYSYMSPDPEQKKFFISDVPYIQYFRGPFAIHAAFWHEDFGEPMSGGCINLSPQDAEHLFGWTEPQLPASWQGVRSGPPNGRGTILQIVP
jgi:lipoprotein-anchoring transpeptidase ErfK/SrfK